MKRAPRSIDARKTAIVLLISLGLLSLTALSGKSQASGSLEVSFINVGQGDSILLRDSAGFDVLVDGGITAQGATVLEYLRVSGVDDVDVLVASHADADHIGGLLTVLQANDIPVEAVVYNGYPGDTATWRNFLTAVAQEGLQPTAAQFPQILQWGEMTAHVLNPSSGLSSPDTNDASLVLRVDYGEMNFLLTGDIDSAVEAAITARGTPIAAEILKVAHHGSAYGSSDAFLAAGDPVESIISVGANSYGHPNGGTLQRILASGSTIWRTDQNGNIVIFTDGVTYSVVPQYFEKRFFIPFAVRLSGVSPTRTPTPEPVTGDIKILSIVYDGSGSLEPDEYALIKNQDSHAVQVGGWTLRDQGNHVFTFPSFRIAAGQSCRVYTNQSHPESCGFSFQSGSAVWNNSGDCAILRDALGNEVDRYCY